MRKRSTVITIKHCYRMQKKN